MFPGVNPKQLQSMMRQMGMSQENIDASEVLVKTRSGKVFVFKNPEVTKVSMQGTTTFQVLGKYELQEPSVKLEISADDVKMVMEGANVSDKEARKALEMAKGDIAQAIVNLQN